MYSIFELNEKSLDDLKMIATEMGIDDENRDRTQLIYDIIDHQVDHPDIKKTAKTKTKKQKTQKNEIPETKPEPVKEETPAAEENKSFVNDYMNNVLFILNGKLAEAGTVLKDADQLKVAGIVYGG